MGKKNRKKKTGKPTVPLEAGGGSTNAASEALTLLPPSGCCHGSKIADFKNIDYIRAIEAYTSMRCGMYQIIQVGGGNQFIDCQLLGQKFDEDYEHLTAYDTNFCAFIFGFCAHLYLKRFPSASNQIREFLELGLRMRYQQQPLRKGVDVGPRSEGYTKWNKYTTDIDLERGMINCLARETPCDCMKPKKLEAKKMDKNGVCNGCKNKVPKNILKSCTGCNMVKYCSRECQVNGWPEHREGCKLISQTGR